jgi:hypothetical protein
MNIGFMACIVLGVLFLIVGILFSLLKEKGAKYVSGFSTLNHPEKYDKAYISLDMRNQCFTYALILFLGAIISYPLLSLYQPMFYGVFFSLSLYIWMQKRHSKSI